MASGGSNSENLEISENEMSRLPSYRIRVTSHARPRWTGAGDKATASQLNLRLSKKRAQEVISIIEQLIQKYPEINISISQDSVINDYDGAIQEVTNPRGSKDTITEARGDYSDNSVDLRRVDLSIESSQKFSGIVGESIRGKKRLSSTRDWEVNVKSSGSASLGLTATVLGIELKNLKSNVSMNGIAVLGGGGPRIGVSASASVGSGATRFKTDIEKDFEDFSGAMVHYRSFGASIFVGYEKSVISFIGFGDGAQGIDVSSAGAGTVGLGYGVITGFLDLERPFPPQMIPIEGSDKRYNQYSRFEKKIYTHQIFFASGDHKLSDTEFSVLDSLIQSIIDENEK